MDKCQWGREATMLVVQMLIGIYVINLGYGFEGTGTRLGEFQFVSEFFRGWTGHDEKATLVPRSSEILWSIPILLPKNYVLGIDIQQNDFEDYAYPSYLRGKFREKGWWYYYAYVALVKIPLGMWALVLGLVTMRLFGWRNSGRGMQLQQIRAGDEIFLLVIPAVIFVVVSSKTGFSHHGRYILPCFPFLYVWTASVMGGQFAGFSTRTARWTLAIWISAMLGWCWVSTSRVYPHMLSYFNELAGGPRGGANHLLQSNVDWGQDLKFLKKWMDAHPEARPMHLAYYGGFDPADVGFAETLPVMPSMTIGERADRPAGENSLGDEPGLPALSPGWHAISVNFVYGCNFLAQDGRKGARFVAHRTLEAFRDLTPVAMAGYSIKIYHVRNGPLRVETTGAMDAKQQDASTGQ